MEKKLPKVFQNNIGKLKNNKSVFYSNKVEPKEEIRKLEIDVNQKIMNIFSSTRYVYKALVVIKTKDATMEKTIIGKNNDSLITIENELIPIKDVKDIYYK